MKDAFYTWHEHRPRALAIGKGPTPGASKRATQTRSTSNHPSAVRAALACWIAIWLAAGCGAERSAGEPARRARVEPPEVVTSELPLSLANAEAKAREICPAETEDARVGTETVKDGAALVFTTSDDVTDLRKRAAVLALPPAMQSADSRLDNIHKGVRRVFEADDAAEIASLRRTVDDHAREIVRKCGFGLAPSRHETEPTRSAQPMKSMSPPTREAAKPKETQAAKEKKDAAQTNDKSTKGKPKNAPKGENKVKVEEKPSEVRKSPDTFKPKEKEKPRLPRLPGVRPDPIAPRSPRMER